MAKQPKIRFKGFTDEWKEKVFSELYYRAIEKNDLSFGPNKIISVANMFFRPDASGVSTDDYMRTYNIMRIGDIAYEGNKSANYANGRWVENYIGDGIISHVFEVLRPKMKYDLMYWRYAINNEYVMRHKLMLSTKKATMMTNIVVSDFLKQTISIPNISEQEKIGKFLSHIDSTISQREKELEKLRNIKRALLEKLFPQDGQTTPSIRFKGFDENWEPKILGNEIEETGTKNRNNLPLESYSITNEAGFIPQNEKFENGGYVADADKTMYTIVPPQSFAYNPARINVGSIGYYNGTKDVIVSSLYIVFKTSEAIHDDFLMAWFKSDIFNHLIYTLQEGGVRQYFFYDKMVQCPILLPKTSEQEKIAKLVNSLNKTISLRERQITLLRHSKQALLEQMFVNE
jgi:type I restriction enzyme S subunit